MVTAVIINLVMADITASLRENYIIIFWSGRKSCLVVQSAMVLCALLTMGLAPNFAVLMVGRCIHGFCAGAIPGVVPIYVRYGQY